jgi:hypothetical protein
VAFLPANNPHRYLEETAIMDMPVTTQQDVSANWMTVLYKDYLKDRPLSQITLPGTHDSGCYVKHDSFLDPFAMTQTENILGQLNGGIRYFDIRPKCIKGKYFTWHGPYEGDQLDGDDGIFKNVCNFLEKFGQNGRELIILNISHFDGFNDDAHVAFITLISKIFGEYLVPYNKSQINLFDTLYGKLLSGEHSEHSRVAILYDGALDQKIDTCVTNYKLPDGFFKVSPKYKLISKDTPIPDGKRIYLFDQYANTTDGVFLKNNQVEKLITRDKYSYGKEWYPFGATLKNNEDGDSKNNEKCFLNSMDGVKHTMHLFSWTLTPGMVGHPLEYAKLANEKILPLFIDNNWGGTLGAYDPTKDAKINIIYVDDYASEKTKNQNAINNSIMIPVNTALSVAIAIKLNGYVNGEFNWENFK